MPATPISLDTLAILNKVPGNYLILLPDAPRFTIVGATDSYLHRTYLKRETALGQGFFETLSDDPYNPNATGVKNLTASLLSVLESRQANHMVDQRYDVLNPQTQQFEVRVWRPTNTPVLDNKGEVQYIIHSVEEVSDKVQLKQAMVERNEAKQSLSESEARFRLFVTASSDTLYKMNADWSQMLNLEGMNFLADTHDPTTSWIDIYIPEEDQPKVREAIADAIASKKAFELDHRVYGADGSIDWVSSKAMPVINKNGEIVEWFGAAKDITAQKKAAEAVLQASERFDLVAKATQDAIWDWNLITNELWWNEGYKELFGYQQEDIEPNVDYWNNNIHPEDVDRVLSNIHNVIKKGYKNWSSEYRFRRKDGSYATVYDRGYALHDKAGKPYRMLGSMQDITERKQSNEALQESEAKYRSLFESMDQGYCTLEIILEGDRCVDYRFLETNPAFERQSGMIDALGKTIRQIAPDIELKWFNFYGSVALTGVPIRIEEESKAFNKWFEVYAIRVGRAEERKVGVYFTDITKRKTTERELQNNKELLQKVYESAPNSIAVMQTLYDDKGQVEDFGILMLNAFTRNVVGPIDYKDKRYSEVFPTVKETGVLDQFKAVATTGVIAIFERQYVGEGMNHWFRFTAVKHDELLVVTTEDITAQKTALQKTEEIVAQRTQELAQANQSLTKINMELARSNQNLEEFAHAASHDMKEPIRKVLTFTDRLKNSLKDRLTDTEKQLFSRVENATQRMGLLVDDLLEFSHVSERPLEKEEVNLNTKVERVLTDLELLIEEKKAQVNVGSLPIIKGYKRQLQQLLQNLIGNALKYSKADQAPIVTLTSHNVYGYKVAHKVLPEQSEQRFHLIEVSDNGIGFEPEYAERIFGMFQRLHGKAEYPGTGVGLSIARKVVENHNGYIWAESKLGEGATFKVLLPA